MQNGHIRILHKNVIWSCHDIAEILLTYQSANTAPETYN